MRLFSLPVSIFVSFGAVLQLFSFDLEVAEVQPHRRRGGAGSGRSSEIERQPEGTEPGEFGVHLPAALKGLCSLDKQDAEY